MLDFSPYAVLMPRNTAEEFSAMAELTQFAVITKAQMQTSGELHT